MPIERILLIVILVIVLVSLVQGFAG